MQIYNHVYSRLLRVVGGISLLAVLTKKILLFSNYIVYPTYLVVVMYGIFNLYIAYHRFKEIRRVLKSNELDIRNSPFDKFATVLGKSMLCVKGVCDYAPSLGTSIGYFAILDQILEAKGEGAVFIPALAKMLPIGNTEAQKELLEYKNKLKELSTIKAKFEDLNNESKLINELVSARFEGEKLFSDNDMEVLKQGFKNQEQLLTKDRDKLLEYCKNYVNNSRKS